MVQDLLHRRIAIDGNAFVDIRVQGASGTEQTLLNLLAAWRRMPGDQTGLPADSTKTRRKQRESGEEDDGLQQELEDLFDDEEGAGGKKEETEGKK